MISLSSLSLYFFFFRVLMSFSIGLSSAVCGRMAAWWNIVLPSSPAETRLMFRSLPIMSSSWVAASMFPNCTARTETEEVQISMS